MTAQAVTCEDFVLRDGGGERRRTSSHFRLWYSQAGTPRVKAQLDPATGDAARVTLEQEVPPTPGQPVKQPMPIPLRLALFGEETGEPSMTSGWSCSTRPTAGARDRRRRRAAGPVDQPRLLGAGHRRDRPRRRRPRLPLRPRRRSLRPLRGDAATDARHVDRGGRDGRGRSRAGDRGGARDADRQGARSGLHRRGGAAAERGLHRRPDAAGRSRGDPRARARRCAADLGRDARARCGATPMPRIAANRYEYNPAAKGARRLRTIALGYIMAARRRRRAGARQAPVRRGRQYDRPAGRARRRSPTATRPSATAALAAFYDRYRDNALVLDKWFTAQALSTRDDTPEAVEALARHPDFTLSNPNRLRSLVGAFSVNQRAFHDAVGPRLSLPRRHDPRRGQAQPADRGQAGPAARPLAPLRRGRAPR